MERLTIRYDGHYVPEKLCTIDRYGDADDCDDCANYCKDCEGVCNLCEIQKCFDTLGAYENTNLTPSQIREIDKAYTEQAKELAELKKGGWIPVSERLPEEYALYNITFINSEGIHADSAIYNTYTKCWFWDADETIVVENEITAWQPLPEPYKED